MQPSFPALPLLRFPRELVFVRDIEEFEGPILSEYNAEPEGGTYVEKWCSYEPDATRFLLVRSEQRAIAEYLNGRMTMLDLLTIPNDGAGFIVDRKMGVDVAVYIVSVHAIPPSYLPDPGVIHDESLRPQWSSAPQSFLFGTE